MPLDEVMNEIESQAFAARVMVASSNKVFFAALSSDTAFRNLASDLETNRGDAGRVLTRLRNLATTQINYRFQNPHDAALAAYAWALEGVDQGLGSVAAELVLSAPQIWWARQVATTILQREHVPLSYTQVNLNLADVITASSASALPYAAIVSGSTSVGSNAYDLQSVSQLLRYTDVASVVMPSPFGLASVNSESGTFGWINVEVTSIAKVVNPKRNEDKVPLRLVA